jgi:hypothetical protein
MSRPPVEVLASVCGYLWDEPEQRGGGVGFATAFYADAQRLACGAPVRAVVCERAGSVSLFRVFESGEYRALTEPEHRALTNAFDAADAGGWRAWWPTINGQNKQ